MLLQEYFICKVLEKVCLLESSPLSALFPRNYRMDDVYKGGLETGLSICNRITRPVTVELVNRHAVAVKRIRRSPKGISDLGLCFG